MKNYSKINIKKYEDTEGSSFGSKEREKLIREIIKLAGKMGWRYSQASLVGKSFCVEARSEYYPQGKTVEESVTMGFNWQSSLKNNSKKLKK